MAHSNILSPFTFTYSPSQSSLSNSPLPSLPKLRLRFPSIITCCGATEAYRMDQQGSGRPRFKDFPYVGAPIRDLMVELVSTVESRLDSQLQPCTLPQDVQYYENQSGSAHATLFTRSGIPPSPIDFILGSWMHSELPGGGAINITSLISYMNDSTDAPQFVLEFIQSSPTSLVLILDLPHRKDLVLHPEYLKTFYEDTGLDKHRQLLHSIPEVQPYFSPSLFVRCAFSPTATLVRIDATGGGGEERLEEILRENVCVAAKEVLNTWLELCVFGKSGDLDEDEKSCLKKRDQILKSNSIEVDLGASLPRLFGQETADRVLGVLRSL